jgi:hypothetical protein
MCLPGRPAKIILFTALVCLLALATLSCNIDAVPGRFTYIVKYEVTGTAGTDANVQYMDETTGLLSVATAAVSPWTEERSCTYLDNNPYDPEFQINALSLPVLGDTITLKIIVKDYKTNFQEEVLASVEVENTGAPLPATPFTLYGDQLPK